MEKIDIPNIKFNEDVDAAVFSDNKHPNDLYVVYGTGYHSDVDEYDRAMMSYTMRELISDAEETLDFTFTGDFKSFAAEHPFTADKAEYSSNIFKALTGVFVAATKIN